MAKAAPQRRFWRAARRLFRWCRVAFLLLVLAVIVAAVWLNHVGVPDFLKARLVAELQSRGFNLRFSRMRLHWYRGLVADQVELGRPGETNAPRVTARQAELLIDGPALLQRQLHLSGVALRGGELTWPISGPNDTRRHLRLERISGEVRFLPPDSWELVGFHANTFGVDIRLGGSVTNASKFKNIKFTRKGPPREKSGAAFWYDVISKLEQSKFDQPASILGSVYGDASDPNTFHAVLNVGSPRVESPWGRGRNVSASVQVSPSTNSAFSADIKLQADDAVTPWFQAGSLSLDADVAPSFTRWTPTNAHLTITVKQARSQWGRAGNVSLIADFEPSAADVSASLAHYTFRAQRVDTPWVKAAQLELDSDAVLTSSNLWPVSAAARLRFGAGDAAGARAAAGTVSARMELPTLSEMRFSDTNFTWWARADLVKANLDVDLSNVQARGGEVKRLAFTADWKNPELALRGVRAELYEGVVNGQAELNTATRRLFAAAKTTVDPHKLSWLLDTNSQKFLAEFTWENSPMINAEAEVVLPSWTNGGKLWKNVDWNAEVVPTLSLRGDFDVGPGSHRNVHASSAKSSFVFSNFTWRLPDLLVTRPEGRARIAHVGNSRTHEFTFDIDSTIDPKVLGPLLGRPEREALESFSFTNMPRLRIQMTGHARNPSATTFHATFAATNFSYVGLPVREARGAATYTNLLLSILQPEVVRSEGTGRADSVRVNLREKRVYIDNATGSLDPVAVTRAVGPKVEEVMKPYRFINAPAGRVNGYVDIEDEQKSDLKFELAGGPFEWMSFRFQQITGFVHWAGNIVLLSNVVASMNGGQVEAGIRLEFPRHHDGCVFSFRTMFNNINLNSLIADLGNVTNRVQGTLNGLLTVTNVNSEITNGWNGYGNVAVNNGLLWDFPVFGIFSPALNAIKPGAGNSIAKEAVATFIITNSVIRSSDLTVHASGMRLKFAGDVGFNTRLNATMQAQLLRDTPGIGWLFSTVLSPLTWLFEYKVTGTLAKPSAYPRPFAAQLRGGLKTLRELGEPRDASPAEDQPSVAQ